MLVDLPTRFSAHLDADVYALLAHRILDGDNRHLVHEPSEGQDPILFRASLDRDAGTVYLLDFPPVTDHVGTDLGEVSATVTIEGDPEGTFDPETGHVEIEVDLTFNPKHVLARKSRVTLALSSDARIDQPELDATGAPLTLDDGTLTLVGEGTFVGGSLNGGSLWLAIACVIDDVVDES